MSYSTMIKALSFSSQCQLYKHGLNGSIKGEKQNKRLLKNRGCRGSDRMVVEITTTFAIGAYHHCCCEFESRSGRVVQHYLIKFVNDLRQIGGFLRNLRFPPQIKLTATI